MSYDSYGFKINRIGMPEEPGATGAKIGEALRYFVDNYWPSIKDWIDAKDGRSEFTQSMCKELWKRNIPEFHAGYIITDDDYSTSEKVETWKIEYYGDFPFAQWSYTVLAFPYDRETSFTRYGDGGYLNWCITGYFTREDNHVYFHETEYSKQKKKEEEEQQQKQNDANLEKHLEDDEDWEKKHHGHVGAV